ncbi:MAG: hypothetical protein GY906_26440, partial [bacterium]|nr:hypothetical protein [bacterium]
MWEDTYRLGHQYSNPLHIHHGSASAAEIFPAPNAHDDLEQNAGWMNAVIDLGDSPPMTIPQYFSLISQGHLSENLSGSESPANSDSTVAYPEEQGTDDLNESFAATSDDINIEHAALLADHERLKSLVDEQSVTLKELRETNERNAQKLEQRCAEHRTLLSEMTTTQLAMGQLAETTASLAQELSKMRLEISNRPVVENDAV